MEPNTPSPIQNTDFATPSPAGNSHAKLLAAVLALIILGAAVFYGYFPKTSNKGVALQNETAKLDKLILEHNCAAAITEAEKYLEAYPNAARIWSLKGGCEFDTGNVVAAKASFEKALALNPEDKGAKMYLENLVSRPGEIKVFASESPFSQADFESRLGITLNATLAKIKIVSRAATIPEYAVGTFTSSKSFSETESYLEGVLKAGDAKLSVSRLSEGTVLASMATTTRKIVSVLKDSPVQVKIEYFKLK